MTLGQVSWLGAVNWEVSALLSIPIAFRLSRYSPKALITISCLGEAPLLFAQGLAPSYWVLLVCRIAYMAIGLARFAARPTLIQQWFPKEKVPLVNGVLTVGMGLASGVVVFFMGDLMQALGGWRNTFYLFGTISAVLLVVWMVLGRENPASGVKEQPQEPGALGPSCATRRSGCWESASPATCSASEPWRHSGPPHAVREGFISLEQASFCEGLSYFGFTAGSIARRFDHHEAGPAEAGPLVIRVDVAPGHHGHPLLPLVSGAGHPLVSLGSGGTVLPGHHDHTL